VSATEQTLGLGRYRVKAPKGWRRSSELEISREVPKLAVTLSLKGGGPSPQPSVALLARPKTSNAEAEVARITDALVAMVRGARAFAPERFVFHDGAVGRRVTLRLPISPTQATVQTHVVQIRGEEVLHLVASFAATDHSRMSGEIDRILASFAPS
jgi:hypothetical protein